jgi:hypothetical protein
MSAATPPVPRGRLSGLFPIPLVGTVAILLVLIVFTPILFATGPPAAGTFETQGELIVDQVAGTTTFYVHAVGETVRYETVSIGVSGNFTWNGSCPSAALPGMVWQNGTDKLEQDLATGSNPVVVQVAASYTEGGSTANYAARLAFYTQGGTLTGSACYGATPPSGGLPTGSLPLVLLLQDWGSGGPP